MQVAHPPSLPSSSRQAMRSQPTPTTSMAGRTSSQSFKVLPSHNHGNGVVATRAIAKGELILVEQPLVVQDDNRNPASILSELCTHPTTLTQAYLGLHNAFGDHMDPILGIFNSNCIPLAPVEPVPHQPGSILEFGVFLQLSRFNNSCSPNTSITWDERRSQITVHAVQSIPPGTEITICYGQPLFATRNERREFLQRSMGFKCTCSCCSLPAEASRASDARRTELCRLFKAVPFLAHDAPAGIRAATQALQTLQSEGLLLYQDSFNYDAHQFCMLLKESGDRSTAEAYAQHGRQWLERAYQWKVIYSGRESDGAMFFAQILAQQPSG